MEIFIVRHGQTAWNIEKKLQGGADIELNEKGIKMAYESGEELMDVHFDRVFSSPLKRAYTTALGFIGGRDIEIETDDRLREISFGAFEGHVQSELNERPGCTFKYFFDAPELYRPEGGGETFEELIERATDFMKTVVEPLVYEENSPKRIMIVGHGAINKAIMCHVKQHGVPEFWSGGLQRNCNVIVLNLTKKGYTVIDETRIFYVPDSMRLFFPERGLNLCDNDEDMYRRILKVFVEAAPNTKNEIDRLISENNYEDLATKIHGLKGNAKFITSKLLTEATDDMVKKLRAIAKDEKNCNERNINSEVIDIRSKFGDEISKMNEIYDGVLDEVKKYLE